MSHITVCARKTRAGGPLMTGYYPLDRSFHDRVAWSFSGTIGLCSKRITGMRLYFLCTLPCSLRQLVMSTLVVSMTMSDAGLFETNH